MSEGRVVTVPVWLWVTFWVFTLLGSDGVWDAASALIMLSLAFFAEERGR